MVENNEQTGHPFARVRACLAQMQQALDGEQVDLIVLAKTYTALAQALLADVQRTGQSSMRFEAVCKALDLRTTKSELQRFLGSKS